MQYPARQRLVKKMAPNDTHLAILFRSLLGMILVGVYAYACDRTGNNFVFHSRVKEFDGEIAFLYFMLFICFLSTFRNVNKDEQKVSAENFDESMIMICRAQTDEWKGWMQVSLLFYHYLFPAPQPLYVYIGARIMVASFLFMTGYGQTVKAVQSGGFYLIELILTLIRLNLLVVVLCIFMGRSYGDYYFAPLVSFWSICIYLLHTTVFKNSPMLRLAIAIILSSFLSFNASRDPSLPNFARILFEPISWLVSSHSTPMDTWLFRLQVSAS